MPNLVPLNTTTVISRKSPFADYKTVKARPGMTLIDILVKIDHPIELVHQTKIFVDGKSIPLEEWPYYEPIIGSTIQVTVVPRGGIGRALLSVVVMIAAVVTAVVTFGLASPLLGATMAYVVAGLAAVAVSTIGLLVINALIPPPVPKLPHEPTAQEQDESKTKFITGGRNRYAPYEPVPRVFGKRRMSPPYAALPYTEVIGDEQYLRAIFLWGYGPLKITDIKIGETPIGYFDGVTIQTKEGWPTDTPQTLYTNDCFEESLNVALTFAGGAEIRTTQANIDAFSFDITCPKGLYQMNDQGYKQGTSVWFYMAYRKVGDVSWTPIGSYAVWSNKTSAVRRGYYIPVPDNGQYELFIQRSTPDSTDVKLSDETYLTALRSIKFMNPISFPHPIAITAVRIKASDQLHGTLDELNGVVSSVLPDWDTDTQTWIERETANPASAFREVLQGKANTRALSDERVDLEQLQHWHEVCEENEWELNYIFDSKQSVHQVLRKIASVGRASPTSVVSNTKWGVIIDEPQDTPIQHFGTDNSWGFQSEIIYPELPHAFKCPFDNREEDWEQDERIVYADGYDQSTATKFETLELIGITDKDHIYKVARYHLADAILRRENYSFYADIEQIRCTRGSLIRVTHDVVLWGLATGRVTERETDGSGNLTAISLDFYAQMEEDVDYNIRVRMQNGDSALYDILTDPINRHTAPLGVDRVVFKTPVPVTEDQPQIGDLVMFGEKGTESKELLVRAVKPRSDLSAQIVCQDYDPAVYTADQGPIPPFNSFITLPTEWSTPIISDVKSDGSVLFMDGSGIWQSRIMVFIQPFSTLVQRMTTIEVAYAHYSEGEYREAWQFVSVPIIEWEVGIAPVQDGDTYAIKARFVKNNGRKGPWSSEVIHTVIGKSGPPYNVTGFQVYQDHGLVVFKWNEVPDKDLLQYNIKYCLAGTGNWVSASTVTTATKGTSMTSKAIPQGIYDFYIKAVDRHGNESENAAIVRSVRVVETYIPYLMYYMGNFPDGTPYTISGIPFNTFVDYPTPPDHYIEVTNLVYDYRLNVFRPKDQAGADDTDDFDCFETWVINPYDEMTWEITEEGKWNVTAEFARFWAQFNGYLPSGETGTWSPIYNYKVWLEEESEPTEWEEGQIVAFGNGSALSYDMRRKLTLSKDDGLFVVQNLIYGVDVPPKYVADVTEVEVGGTYIKYGSYFATIPSITGNVIDGDGVSVVFSDVDQWGCTITVYDSDGSDVGGTVNWAAQAKPNISIPGGG